MKTALNLSNFVAEFDELVFADFCFLNLSAKGKNQPSKIALRL
ncbi:hypothetical protein CAMRE0001_2734 [Campylobacter rectus RM3267]|uniref:Uncharacterized protein n=1 Tax=Campylobacter rectus RM3267 TaxID=553218 RepID=B9D0T8_CAMRE|nr:hypothetical protein CAMRE0001_2734 [Campylobacter rectus RM3267]